MTSLAPLLRNWLYRWRSDGSEPIVLTQRRIFILPSRAGLLFALVLSLMFLGAVNYNLALGHALVFMLAGLGLTGMVHAFRNLAGLILAGGRAEPVFAGEIAHFPMHLSNDRHVPRLGLEFQAGDGAVVVCDLLPGEQRRIELPVPARRRGWLELPRTRLSTRYPLGLFVAWSYPQPAMRCLVYPQPQDMPMPAPSPTTASGDLQGSGGQDDFAGLRVRQPADSPRHIAWKAVARDFEQRPLLVKQFSGGAHSQLWLDWHHTPPESDGENRLSILTGWVLTADQAGILYGLSLPGIRLPPAAGEPHRRRCLEALALFQQP